MLNLPQKFAALLCLCSSVAHAQDDHSEGGYAGVAKEYINEAEKLNSLTRAEADNLIAGYENGQQVLGEAVHNGMTVSLAGEAQQFLGKAAKVAASLFGKYFLESTQDNNCDSDPNCTIALEQSESSSTTNSPFRSPNAITIRPPKDNDINDLVRWVFESQKCVATESDIFEAINSRGYGMMVANNVTVAWSEKPSVAVISRDPYTYRLTDTDYCKSLN